LSILAALATGKVTISALKKGMRMSLRNALSSPESFLQAHLDSDARLAEAADLIVAA